MEPYQQLEKEWEAWAGVQNAVACSSGTAALHLALEVLQLPPGSEILMPDFTMIACPRAATLAGLRPVFVDCDERLLMDGGLVREAQREGPPRALMAVHVYGRVFDFETVYGPGVRSPLTVVVEDLAEAHGVQPHRYADAACWSFYKNKIVAGEEGGIVAFKNPAHAARARELRALGFTSSHDFWHTPRGHNYRMSNAHAELILADLNKPGGSLFQRRLGEGLYDRVCPQEWRMPQRDVPWVYDFRIPGLGYDLQSRIVRELNLAGVRARHGFKPCHLQEEFRGHRLVTNQGPPSEPESVFASREVIYLPLPGPPTVADVRRHFEIVKRALSA